MRVSLYLFITAAVLAPLWFAAAAGTVPISAVHESCVAGIEKSLSLPEAAIPEPPGEAEIAQPFVRGVDRTSSGYRLSYIPDPMEPGSLEFPYFHYNPGFEGPAEDLLFNTVPGNRKMRARGMMQNPLKGLEYGPPAQIVATSPFPIETGQSGWQLNVLPFEGAPRDRLKSYLGQNPGFVGIESTHIAQGGYSEVYALHPPVPRLLPARFLNETDWAMRNSTLMAKVRRADRQGVGTRSAMYNYLRDLVVGKLADQLFSRVKFRGKQLIRVEPITGDLAAAQRGIVFQKPVHGVSAQDLAVAVDEFLAPTELFKPGVTGPVLQKAIDTLKKAGFVDERGQVTEAHARDALEHIQALEQSYRLVNEDALNYQYSNRLAICGQTLENPQHPRRPGDPPSRLSLAGFDYNHGQNVIWDPKTRMFVVIDW